MDIKKSLIILGVGFLVVAIFLWYVVFDMNRFKNEPNGDQVQTTIEKNGTKENNSLNGETVNQVPGEVREEPMTREEWLAGREERAAKASALLEAINKSK